MSVSIIIRCGACEKPISAELFEVVDRDDLREGDGETLLPAGKYAWSDLIVPEEMFYNTKPSELLVRREDLVGVTDVGPRAGCCGPSDHVPNVACLAGHVVGTEYADCWTPRFVRLSLSDVRLSCDGR